jgi:hypothetical protein
VTSFIALYRGDTVSGAKLVALTADQRMVQDFAARLVEDEPDADLRPNLRLVEGSTQNKDVKRPTAGLEQVGRKDGTKDKENSAYGCIIPQT